MSSNSPAVELDIDVCPEARGKQMNINIQLGLSLFIYL